MGRAYKPGVWVMWGGASDPPAYAEGLYGRLIQALSVMIYRCLGITFSDNSEYASGIHARALTCLSHVVTVDCVAER